MQAISMMHHNKVRKTSSGRPVSGSTSTRRPPRPARNDKTENNGSGHGNTAALERALSKLGYASRSQAHYLVTLGRVQVNGQTCRDPERRVNITRDRIAVDGKAIVAAQKVYLALNKPRGLITTAGDEKGRDTVYDCLSDWHGERVFPVGRLDKASEGLLFFTNDTRWSDNLTSPSSHLDKTYHVQINCVPGDQLLQQLVKGITDPEVGFIKAAKASLLRSGEKNAWLEIILDEGRNRQIRRLFAALDIEVLRLVRVAIGPIPLGTLAKGSYRRLTDEELRLVEQALRSNSR